MPIIDEDWERLVLDRIQAEHQPIQWTDPAEEDDHHSLMARRPRPAPPSDRISSSSAMSSSSTCPSSPREKVWKRTVILTLDGRIASSLWPWNDGDELHEHAAQAFDLHKDDIEQVHYVPDRPADLLRVDLQCLLLQRCIDV